MNAFLFNWTFLFDMFIYPFNFTSRSPSGVPLTTVSKSALRLQRSARFSSSKYLKNNLNLTVLVKYDQSGTTLAFFPGIHWLKISARGGKTLSHNFAGSFPINPLWAKLLRKRENLTKLVPDPSFSENSIISDEKYLQ